MLGLSRILVTGNTRIRLANVGVIDVLEADVRRSPCGLYLNMSISFYTGKAMAEVDDVVALGHLVLTLATKTLSDVTSTSTNAVAWQRTITMDRNSVNILFNRPGFALLHLGKIL